MFSFTANQHQLKVSAAAPETVAAVERLLTSAAPGDAVRPLPEGKILKGLIFVYGTAEPGEAGPLVVQHLTEANNILNCFREIQNGIASLANGQARLLAQGPPASVEPASDEEAARLFGLLRVLELETKFRKAPVTRVFLLYCLDGKSRDAVARDCNCSPALISLRLKVIEKKLGRKPAQLRECSAQFERIADALTDGRARRIDRARALDGGGPEDDD